MPGDAVVCEFCFHGVGHGLFYTGKIGRFSFVYDCGSSSSTTVCTKIERFSQNHLPEVARQGEKVKLLPFLFISHLHYDHVSGLEALFKAGVKVDYVFLPYLSPWERLLLALLAATEVGQFPPWYLEMLRDPVDFLIGKGVGKVIMLIFSSSGGGGGPIQPGSIDIDGLPGYHVYLDGLEELDEHSRQNILSHEESAWEQYRASDRLWLAVANPNPKP